MLIRRHQGIVGHEGIDDRPSILIYDGDAVDGSIPSKQNQTILRERANLANFSLNARQVKSVNRSVYLESELGNPRRLVVFDAKTWWYRYHASRVATQLRVVLSDLAENREREQKPQRTSLGMRRNELEHVVYRSLSVK